MSETRCGVDGSATSGTGPDSGPDGRPAPLGAPVSAERWAVLEPLLDELLELAPGEILTFVERASPDPNARAEILRMLEECALADPLLEVPAAERFPAVLEARLEREIGDASAPSGFGGRFEIVREIGRGGMATVYLARDVRHGREVALKVLNPWLAEILGAGRFLEEIRLTAALRHPHVLPLFDSGEAEGRFYFAAAYVEGASLRTRLTQDGQITVAEAVRILREVASALAHAHAHGVVHRDIKPENILLGEGGAVVADFGIAEAIERAGAEGSVGGGADRGRRLVVSARGPVLGTPAYMAPEQGAGDPAADHRVDLYALGVLAYEMLTGSPPFAGRPRHAVRAAHAAEAPESIERRRPNLPPALATLVMRLLEKNPANRPQSADEVLRALDAVTTVPSAGAPPGETPLALPATRTRGRRQWLMAAGVAVALVAGAWAMLYWRGEAGTSPIRVVVVPPDNRTGDASLDHVAHLVADRVASGLLQSGIGHVAEPLTVIAVKAALAAREPGGGASLALHVARETGATHLVSGAYDRVGDSIRFQLQVSDVAGDRLLASLGVVTAAIRDPTPAVETLRHRVSGALAAFADPQFKKVATGATPAPSYEAYKLVSEGWEAFHRDKREAVRLYERALALDSTYEFARIFLANAYLNMDEFHLADSLLRVVDKNAHRLSAFERLTVAWHRAQLDGDHIGSYRVVQQLLDLWPTWQTVLFQLGLEAEELNRPREALRHYARVRSRSAEMSGRSVFWDRLAGTHHVLGNYGEELAAARAGRAQYPDLAAALEVEVRALAAVGRVADVEQLLTESEGLPLQAEHSPGEVARQAALEFRAHDEAEAASHAAARAVAWYEAQPALDRQTRRREYAEALYAAAQWPEAREVVRNTCRPTPDDVACLGRLATLAARVGDKEEARRLERRLAEMPFYPPVVESRVLLWRARIAAVLFHRDTAVTRLQHAFGRGLEHGPWVHRDADLQLLDDFPPYRKLFRTRK